MRKNKVPYQSGEKLSVRFSGGSRHVALILLILAICIVLMRAHTYTEPIERDIGSHAVIAHELLEGRKLYSDLWDSKPPAIFITYALADALVGQGPVSVYIVGIAAALITLLGVYYAASAYGGQIAGLWAAAFWTFICSDLWLWANQPNIEVGINASIVWAFALVLHSNTKRISPIRWILIGLLFTLATLYKQIAIVFPAIICSIYFLLSLRDKKQTVIALSQICIILMTGVLTWLAVFGYFAITDRVSIFYETIFNYGIYYSRSRGGNVLENILQGLSDKRLWPVHMQDTLILVILAITGMIFGLVKGVRRYWLLLLGFAIASQLSISLPGRFYGHYYQLWLGPLTIASGWAVSVFGKKDKTGPRLLRNSIGSVGLVILLCTVMPQYRLSPDEWSARKQGSQYIYSKRLAMELDKMLQPDETFYVWGINPEIYYWSRRHPPTGIIWATDLMDNPLAESNSIRALEDLRRNPPEIIVVNMQHIDMPPEHPIINWAFVEGRYVPFPGNSDRGMLYGRPLFKIFVHRDGRLIKELIRISHG